MALVTTKPGDDPKPPIITLGGVAGTGKSTLAALFTIGRTLWLPVEDTKTTFSTWQRDIQPDWLPELPRPSEGSVRQALMQQLKDIRTQPHDFDGGTLVVDSISVLQKLFEEELCLKEKKENVEDCAGGFQKCYVVIGRWHQALIEECKRIRNERNMGVIFTTHTEIRKIRNKPDAEEHSIWDMNMAARCASHYIDQSDAVMYLRMDEFIRGRETNNKGQVTKLGKSASTGKHILVTSSEGNMGFPNAKNRWNLDPKIEIPLFENPLLSMIPWYSQGSNAEE